jgi:transposase-like protein
MKAHHPPIQFDGASPLTVSPEDPLLWKLAMILEAALSTDQTVEEIAARYGYKRESFYQVKAKLTSQGSQSLADRPPGPKTNYRRDERVTRQVILHRFLDPEANCQVITQKMKQAGHQVSQRTVERIIGEYGLQKKGYIKQWRRGRASR